MTNKRALRAALAAVCLAAAAQLPGQAQPTPTGTPSNPCAAARCEIHITVTEPCSAANIKLSQDPYHIAVGNNGRIHWIIDTAGYELTGKGIAWKKAEGKKEFDTPDYKKGEVSWHNKHSKKWNHDYVIELKGPNGICRKDPTVVNG